MMKVCDELIMIEIIISNMNIYRDESNKLLQQDNLVYNPSHILRDGLLRHNDRGGVSAR